MTGFLKVILPFPARSHFQKQYSNELIIKMYVHSCSGFGKGGWFIVTVVQQVGWTSVLVFWHIESYIISLPYIIASVIVTKERWWKWLQYLCLWKLRMLPKNFVPSPLFVELLGNPRQLNLWNEYSIYWQTTVSMKWHIIRQPRWTHKITGF